MRQSLRLMIATLLLTEASAFGATQLPEAVLKERDPFKRPPIKMGAEGPKSELQSFPVEKFKLLGVMTGEGGHMKAMLQAPNNRTYFVQEKMFIGIRNGFITKITDDAVIVREKIVNVFGQEEAVNSEILLPSDATQDVKKISTENGW